MKQSFFFLFLVISAGIRTSAQVYVRLGGGYGFPANQSPANSYLQREALFLTSNNTPIPYQDMFYVYPENGFNYKEVINTSFASGGHAGLAAGYMFIPQVGLEVGVSYFWGQKVISGWRGVDLPRLLEERYAKSLFITPSVVLTWGKTGINPYVRLGAGIGLNSEIKSYTDLDLNPYNFNNPFVITFEDVLSEGKILTFSAGGGMVYPISPMVSMTVEAFYNGGKYTPRKRTVTRLALNDQELDVSKTYAHPEQRLEKNAPDNSATPFASSTQKAYGYPFSNFGLNVGVRLGFGMSKGK